MYPKKGVAFDDAFEPPIQHHFQKLTKLADVTFAVMNKHPSIYVDIVCAVESCTHAMCVQILTLMGVAVSTLLTRTPIVVMLVKVSTENVVDKLLFTRYRIPLLLGM
jgi:hypothetical protein